MTTEAEGATQTPPEPTDEQRNAAFAGGYDDTAPAETPTPPAGTETPTTQEATPPAEEEFVQITKKDFDRIMAALPNAETLPAELAKVNGTIGNVKTQFLQRQAAGPALKITDDDFAEMREEYPELAGQTKAAFERILSRMGAGGTGGTAPIDPETLKAAVKEARELELVTEVSAVHPGWIEEIGKPGDLENPYRKWVASQPEDYQKRLNNTFSPRAIIESLDRWKAAAATPTPTPTPPAKRGADRTDRLKDAVPLKGGGAAPAPAIPTRQDAFQDGYRSG